MCKSTPTLTFLSYTDFLGELAQRRLTEVRLQEVVRQEVYDSYLLVLTALASSDAGRAEVLVCNLQVARGQPMSNRHEQHHANLRTAAEIVRLNLTGQGFSVRPGVWAHESGWGSPHRPARWAGDASADDLWALPVAQELAQPEAVRWSETEAA
jgi:hypothetical protein